MHEQVVFVHVLLNQSFVLLCVLTGNDQVVLARDKPVELLEPEHLPLSVHSHYVSMLVYLFHSLDFSLLYRHFGSSLGLLLLLVALFLDFKVLFDVHLC